MTINIYPPDGEFISMIYASYRTMTKGRIKLRKKKALQELDWEAKLMTDPPPAKLYHLSQSPHYG